MKATDAKKFIGKRVQYRELGSPFLCVGTVTSTIGRYIIVDGQTLWAPLIRDMKLVEEQTEKEKE